MDLILLKAKERKKDRDKIYICILWIIIDKKTFFIARGISAHLVLNSKIGTLLIRDGIRLGRARKRITESSHEEGKVMRLYIFKSN